MNMKRIMVAFLVIIAALEAVEICLLVGRRADNGSEGLYDVIGKIVFQDYASGFPAVGIPSDSVFRAEAGKVFASLSLSEKMQFLTWAGLRYKDSTSVMTAICELAEKYNVRKEFEYYLMVQQDNARNKERGEELQSIRNALKWHADGNVIKE